MASSTTRQRELELERLQHTARVAELKDRQEANMGPMEKRLDLVLTTQVKAYRQTFGSRQLTGHGIGKVLSPAGREVLVSVFAGTEWEEVYRWFLENYAVYHHIAMSLAAITPRRQAALEMAVRNLSILVATKFKCAITPKMDVLFTQVVPYVRMMGNLGISREEGIEREHRSSNVVLGTLACIRKKEERLFQCFQRLELKNLNKELGQPKRRGERSEEEKSKREVNVAAKKARAGVESQGRVVEGVLGEQAVKIVQVITPEHSGVTVERGPPTVGPGH